VRGNRIQKRSLLMRLCLIDYCYVFPPFSLLPRCVRKIKQDKAKALVIAPLCLTQTWFPLLMKLLVQKPVILPKGRKLYLPHQEVVHPLEKKLVLMACSVRQCYRKQGFSRTANRIIMSSWRKSTKREYQCYISRWLQYCDKQQVFQVSVSVNDVIEFLTEQYNKGFGYSALNTARGALFSLGIRLESFPAGSHPTVVLGS